jgi:hypothetical protein
LNTPGQQDFDENTGALSNHAVAIIARYFAHIGANDRGQLALEGTDEYLISTC